MYGTAAHLVDRVLSSVPVRQWVLSVPFELRLLLAKNHRALSAVGRILVRERHPPTMLSLSKNTTGACNLVGQVTPHEWVVAQECAVHA